MTYHIMSFDGGGVRGTLSTVIANRITQLYPTLLSQTDVYAGTSTGGIIALALAAGVTLPEILQLYVKYSREVFSGILPLGMVKAKYDNDGLHKVLKQYFGDMTLGDLKAKVVIPAFDLDDKKTPSSWGTKVFNNFCADEPDKKLSVVDVCLATSAAPTYFPSYQGYIDGGLVANNPTLCAVAQMFDPTNHNMPISGLRDLRVLSLSTGCFPKYIEGDSLAWGLLQWGMNLIDIPMDGAVAMVDYQCRQLLGQYYHRITPLFTDNHFELDDYDRIPELVTLGDSWDIKPTLDWLNLISW